MNKVIKVVEKWKRSCLSDWVTQAQEEFFSEKPASSRDSESTAHQPLAARMRAQSLEEIVGQDHLLGENCLLPKLLKNNQFWEYYLLWTSRLW